MSEVRARKLRRLRWFLLWVKDKPNPRRAGKVTITSSDYASLTPLFQVSLRRNLTKKPPGRDPRRCPLMMSKNGSRRSTTLVASSASRNIATVTRFSCNLSHYGFGHHMGKTVSFRIDGLECISTFYLYGRALLVALRASVRARSLWSPVLTLYIILV